MNDNPVIVFCQLKWTLYVYKKYSRYRVCSWKLYLIYEIILRFLFLFLNSNIISLLSTFSDSIIKVFAK